MSSEYPLQSATDSSITAFADTVINEWLDRWDAQWQPGLEHLKTIAQNSHFIDDARALSELIRVDIDRRYATNNQLIVSEYIHEFPILLTNRDAMAAIAFEDFRARQSSGLLCDRSRWSWIPGIAQQDWYAKLSNSRSSTNDVSWSVSSADAENPSKVLHSVEPEIGGDFGEFRLIGFLGDGAFSRVFLATQRLLGDRYVALKVVRRTLSEPRHLARLHHTGIVPLYSLHRIGQYSALCMPYSGATTLADWLSSTDQDNNSRPAARPRSGQSLINTLLSTQAKLKQTTLPGTFDGSPNSLPEWQTQSSQDKRLPNAQSLGPLDALVRLPSYELALWMACRLAAALGHAHARGIVHGDLKPANILIRNDGEPSLIDFNLSYEFDNQDIQRLGGTLPYMPPEQMKALVGRTTLLSSRSDVYALGIILYEIVEGRLPFTPPASAAECDLDVAITVRQTEKIHFSTGSCEAGFQAIVSKCLAYDPSDRYADGGQLWEDLEAEVRHQPLKYTREPFDHKLRKLSRRHPAASSNLAISTFAVAVVSLCALFGWVGLMRWQALAAQTTLHQFIGQTEAAHSRMLDCPLESVDEFTADWLRQTRATLQYDGLDWNQSQLIARLSAQDREQLLPALFEQVLALAWLTVEHSIDKPSLAHSQEYVQLLQLLQQLEQQHQQLPASPMLQSLVEQGKTENSGNNRSETATTVGASQPGDIRYSFAGQLESSEAQIETASNTEQILWARLQILIGKAPQALERLAKVKDARVSRFLYWDTTGKAHMRLGKQALASQSFLQAMEAAPNSLIAHQQCATARIALGEYAGADKELTQAIEIADPPDSPAVCDVLLQRAMVRERLKRVDAALDDANRAAQLGHMTNRVWLLKARLKSKLGDAKGASEDMALGLKADPKTADDCIARALTRASKQPQEALDDLKQALLLDPNSTTALQNMAYIQTDLLHDETGALITLNRIIQIEPDHEKARGGRCVLLARAGKEAESLADIAYLEKNIPRLQPVTLYQFGSAYALLSKQQPKYVSQAMTYVVQALPLYGADVVQNDPDLDNLREQPAFQHLVELSKTWKKP